MAWEIQGDLLLKPRRTRRSVCPVNVKSHVSYLLSGLMNLHSPLGTDFIPFHVCRKYIMWWALTQSFFRTISLIDYISIFYSILCFLLLQWEKKNKNAVASGNSSVLSSFSPEVTIISTATNCDVSRRIDFCLFICPPTQGWIGYRPVSFPFPFSSHWFNKDGFNKAPFSICSTETIHKNNFKFNPSLGVNFVDKENNIKVTEMSIILAFSLGGF